MRPPKNNSALRLARWVWVVLWIFALGLRLPAAFLLPNPEQDGYSYVEKIAQLSAKLAGGHFRLPDLFGFWLPLFQFLAAIPNMWIGNPLLTGKIVSALFGATSCVLVFTITGKLTRNIAWAWVAFAIALSNPLHILYSAASMTDVPYGCLILASVWFVLQKRWIAAATCAALAEGVRFESWVLILVIPFLQFLREHRISPLALVILLLPPLAWFALSFAATGDLFAYFHQRVAYQSSYLDFYPSRRGFALTDILQDLDYLLLGTNRVVFLAMLLAGGLSIFHAFRRSPRFCWQAASIAIFAFAILGFLFIGYLTKRQPVILPRYALVFFLLGLPLLAWLVDLLVENRRQMWIVAAITLGLCLVDSERQILILRKVQGDFRAHRQIADALRTALGRSLNDVARCFSDDVAVRVLTKLPADRFLRSEAAPAETWMNRENFESYLRDKHVEYLVFMPVENSLPVKFIPDLGHRGKIDIEKYRLLSFASSPFGPDVWLYRCRLAE